MIVEENNFVYNRTIQKNRESKEARLYMERYDIAIIGTGPAGLSAAVTAAIRKKKILLVGSRDLSSKVQKAQEIQNYLGFPEISGAELGKAFEEHIERMQIPIVEDRVNLIYPMGDYFSLQVGQDICEADTVILATGFREKKNSWAAASATARPATRRSTVVQR